MANRKSAKKKAGKKAGRKKSAKTAAKKSAKKSASRRPARRAAGKRAAARRPARKAAKPAASSGPPKIRHGVITHTELASSDPEATQEWCQKVLGWNFAEPMPTPAGPYRMWRFPNETGGGIRSNNPPEQPGSIPYVEVDEIQTVYANAIDRGATPMMPPEALPGGMGWIAIVAAPGGVPIGFWSMK